MSTRFFALALVFGAVGLTLPTLSAQQSMPGMDMPAAPAKPHPQTPAPKPNRSKQHPDPAAPDLQGMHSDTGNQKAKAAAASERDSVEQQTGQTPAGGASRPGQGADAASFALPFQAVQEPEAADIHTGTALPAPELLRDVVTRSPVTLDSFLHMAEANNPTLAEAQRNLDRSAQQARQAGLPPDPSAGYSAEHIRGGSYHGGEQGAFVSQDIVLGHKLALRRDVYRAEGHANQFAIDAQRARIHDDVAAAFYHALASQEAVTVQDRLLGVALDAQTNAHELERIGQADASAVLDAEIDAEQAKIEFEEAQRAFLTDFSRLATVAGQLSLPPQPLTGSLVEPPALDAEGLVAQDVQESPAVKQAQAEVVVAEARLKSAKREPVPDLNIKAGEWYSGEILGEVNKETGPMSFAEVGVQLPLWNRNQGNIGAAEAEVERARQSVARLQLMTRHEAEPLAQQYQTSRATVERYRTAILPRARRAFQLETIKYQQMAEAYPQVLTAQRTLFSLQLTYLRALDEEWHAAIALQNYALMNSLEVVSSTGEDTTDINRPTDVR